MVKKYDDTSDTKAKLTLGSMELCAYHILRDRRVNEEVDTSSTRRWLANQRMRNLSSVFKEALRHLQTQGLIDMKEIDEPTLRNDGKKKPGKQVYRFKKKPWSQISEEGRTEARRLQVDESDFLPL